MTTDRGAVLDVRGRYVVLWVCVNFIRPGRAVKKVKKDHKGTRTPGYTKGLLCLRVLVVNFLFLKQIPNLFRKKRGLFIRKVDMQDWQQILSKAQQGDLNAFDALVQQFRDMATAYAYSILGERKGARRENLYG